MKALSIHPYPATCIAAGEKKIEYRSWSTSYRGPLLVCASQFRDGPEYPRGYALCVVELTSITGSGRNYEWHLGEVALIKPFPVKGKLHLFEVPDENISRLCYEDNMNEAVSFDRAYDYWLELGICKEPG